ncbi:hypothetical protein GCM10010156_35480 [Planobispora rosea]|uniref:DUF3566 domain-containing protein n=1 Tax=Planobispora rosea TaxID=35762 RepID=A0A8J3RWU7_PLARO|nr:DUF3566 domain-containing protein [Planobispora rosea]GGS73524.1 hypothetical protein GCM10010156_35480 [Planobispora rosea]GIH81621.1 hypothetical protein Pro02_00290 [Planobispora rosea]
MDKTTETDVVEVVESPDDGNAPTPATDDSATDELKGRSKVKAIEDDQPGDSTIRIRPASAETAKAWAPGPVSPGPVSPGPVSSPAAPPQPAVDKMGPVVADRMGPAGLSAPSSPELGSKKGQDGSAPRTPRKAHLVLRRIEPWSAMKFSFVLSLVCFVVLFVAVAVLYMVLSGLGVFDSITDAVNKFTQGEGSGSAISFDIASWFEPVRILGYTALIGAVNVVLVTALSTIGAVIYNVASDLVGGVEVTFSEAE